MITPAMEQRCDCCGSTDWAPLFEENGFRLGQCQDCDLLYIDKMPSPRARMTEIEGGHFAGRQHVLNAEKQSAAEVARAKVFVGYLDTVREHVTTGRWLDIGCGGGHLLTVAEHAGFEVEGVELTTERRLAAERAGLTVHDRPVEDLHLGSGSFDVISLIDVFSHLTSPTRTFCEIRRILADGGVLIVATGESQAAPRRKDVFSWNLGDHLFFLGARTIQEYAARTGFSVIHYETTWLPREVYSRDRLSIRGRFRARNLIKGFIVDVPGLLPLFRSVMLARQHENPLYSAVIVLT